MSLNYLSRLWMMNLTWDGWALGLEVDYVYFSLTFSSSYSVFAVTVSFLANGRQGHPLLMFFGHFVHPEDL